MHPLRALYAYCHDCPWEATGTSDGSFVAHVAAQHVTRSGHKITVGLKGCGAEHQMKRRGCAECDVATRDEFEAMGVAA